MFPRLYTFLNSTKVFVLVLSLSLLFWFPKISSEISPAVTVFEVDIAASYKFNNRLYLEGIMVKNRCKFLGVLAEGYDIDNNVIHIGIIFQDGKTDQTANRIKGPQKWGPWEVVLPITPDVKTFSIKTTHLCDFGFLKEDINYVIHTTLIDQMAVNLFQSYESKFIQSPNRF